MALPRPYLARKYTVAALDLSGHGDSDHRDRYSGETFAREVFAVCEAALPPKPFVIGHSFGGLWPCKRPTILASNCGGDLQRLHCPSPKQLR